MTKFYFAESQSFVGYSPKYIKYYVCGIKLETKVMRLHKMWVEKIFIVSSKEVCCQLLLTITCNVPSQPI